MKRSKHWWILLLLFVVNIDTSFGVSESNLNENNYHGCPQKCWCYYTSVRCMFQGLTKIPKIPANTTILDLRFNEIDDLPVGVFHGLKHLDTILLNDNKIKHLKKHTFSGLRNLKILNLHNNHITLIAPGTFAHLPNLRQLHLHSNKLTEILAGTFNDLPKLERLFLQNNQIRRLPANAFENIGFMTRLRLDFNPLECDCDLLWLVTRFQENPTVEMTAVCHSPAEVKGRSLTSLFIDDFHCHMPKIMKDPEDIKVNVGDTAYFTCQASGDPKPRIKWMRNSDTVNVDGKRYLLKDDGTLVIFQVNENDIGEYECIAESKMGYTISRKARAIVTAALPAIRFIEVPQSQTVKVGDTIILTCRADSKLSVQLEWWRNGQRIHQDSRRVFLENEGSKLKIHSAQHQDSARYICQARNINGFAEVSADIKVLVKDSSTPILTYKPSSDLEVELGATVELPCRAKGEPKPQIHWKKDGSAVEISPRFKISRGGSLYIYNITNSDTGRYECNAVNDHGRVTAQCLVRVRDKIFGSLNNDIIQRAFNDATIKIDRAINQTLVSLFGQSDVNDKAKNNNQHRTSPSGHVDLFRLARFPNFQARAAAKPAEIFERTLYNIRQYINQGHSMNVSGPFKYEDILSKEQIEEIEKLSECTGHRKKLRSCSHNTCFNKRYRSIDGNCNNLDNPMWGASYTGFRRILQPIYENGISQPVGWDKKRLYYGFPKPPARLVSTKIISTHKITPDTKITHMVMQWGQFLDHDLDHALPAISSESWDGIDCKKSCEHAAPCFPMEVPRGDPRITNRRCIDFIRTSAVCGSGATSILWGRGVMPREQMNQLTSYLDASQVYGYNDELALDLRDRVNGRDRGLLREGVTFPDKKPLLPYASGQFVDCRRDVLESSINCFVAGDIRANEQVGLLAMHTIWLREHNRLARELANINPHWNGEKIYQEARKIVGAEMQHITYHYWLPTIFGQTIDELIGPYLGYNHNLDASISNVFATAALRFGHSLIQPRLERLDEQFRSIPQGPLNLRDAFFAPWRLVDEGGVDPLIRGMFATAAKLKLPEENLNTELTEQLFRTAHAVALDLASMNIQRGRDHGIPGYLEWRKFCNMSVVDNFDDLVHEISSEKVRRKLRELYGHPGNMDVWVGGILEDQLPGSKVGPLFKCLLVEQFKRTRDGDRFWYENPTTFKPEQLQQIKKITLSRILCDNGDNITEIQPNVFYLFNNPENSLTSCDNIPEMNLQFWSDCCDNCDDDTSNTIPRFRRAINSNKYTKAFNNYSVIEETFEKDSFDSMEILDKNKESLVQMIDFVEDETKKLNKIIRHINKRVKKLKEITLGIKENKNMKKKSEYKHKNIIADKLNNADE
ncbi:peroxidasin [Chelonus insularis]|uniref:peroxidasin n=1 Tax=Chelonus insularis TaxID=460826 RepID=UPI001589D4B7|nr:peroxidasin [Chelonus insularis]